MHVKQICISALCGFLFACIIFVFVIFSIRGGFVKQINQLKNDLSIAKSGVAKTEKIIEQQRETITGLEGIIERERRINQAERAAYTKLETTNTGLRNGIGNIEKLNTRGYEIINEIEKLIQDGHN